MKAQLKPVVWTVLPKIEFSTTYLFEEQGTSEGYEWFQIDLKCDQGALSDSFTIKVGSFKPFRGTLLLKQIIRIYLNMRFEQHIFLFARWKSFVGKKNILKRIKKIYIRNSKIGDRKLLFGGTLLAGIKVQTSK